jgi:HlyD family secretion protein
MRLPRIRFPARWVVTAAILASVMAVLVAIERKERRRNAIAVARAEIAYREAKHARDRAERAVTEYAERTFPRELATVEAEIKRDEDALNYIKTARDTEWDWAERIRSKGYLLLIRGVESKELAVRKATFIVEQAKSKKAVLERYTRVKALKELKDQVAKARADELAKKAAYDEVSATELGPIGRFMGRK